MIAVVDYDDARGRHYVYRGHRLLAGAQYTLPWRAIRLTYDFDLHYRDYLHPHTLRPVRARSASRDALSRSARNQPARRP